MYLKSVLFRLNWVYWILILIIANADPDPGVQKQYGYTGIRLQKTGFSVHCRVADLYGIHLIRIRIQHFRLNTDPDSHPIRILGFWWPKIENIHCWKKIKFLDKKLQITHPSGLHKGRPSYKRSLQLSKENIQPFKTRNFLIFFLLLSVLWIVFALLDPDPLFRLNPGTLCWYLCCCGVGESVELTPPDQAAHLITLIEEGDEPFNEVRDTSPTYFELPRPKEQALFLGIRIQIPHL